MKLAGLGRRWGAAVLIIPATFSRAITALASPKPQPGQYLLAAFHAILARLLRARRTLQIRLHWVPAHIGIVGNEAVDACAKAAAQGASSPLATRIKLFESALPVSRAAVIAAGAKEFAAQWREEWSKSPRHTRISTFDDATPSKALEKMYEGLSRPQCSVLTQLRTGHIGLNAYLHRFKLAPSPSALTAALPSPYPTSFSYAPPTALPAYTS
ncbi:hypothetical protein B0H13DRAFT_2437275 [Mycena leptocephala]|nr:hypothetical protein B0H13DRAFT_2437275 [Mycena leptocephala]